jgi:subtilisin family serine protease
LGESDRNRSCSGARAADNRIVHGHRPLTRRATALAASILTVVAVGAAAPAQAAGGTTLDVLKVVDGEYVVETVTVPSAGAEAAADRLEDAPEVVVASPSVTYQIDAGFDPYWDTTDPQAISAVRDVWSRTRGEGQIVAVLDSAVDTTHDDLAGAFVPGTDTAGGSGANWHGTGVAGIVAARAENNIGSAGMAPEAKIMPVRVCNDTGCPSAALARGIFWAADHGADVINMSLSGKGFSDVSAAAVQYALDKNISVVASAGNDGLNGNPVMYPAALSGVIGVSSTKPDGTPSDWAVNGWQVDISTVGDSVFLTMPGDGYGSGSGTSFSGPAVAGAVALLRSAVPGITPEQVQAALQAGSASESGWPRSYGAGRLHVPSAMAAADRADSSVTITPAASQVTVNWPAVPGATSYTVRIDGSVRAEVAGTTTTVTGLTDGNQVAVDVQPSNGVRSRPVLSTVGPAAPGTPTLHSAALRGTSTSATLDLTASVAGTPASRYSIVRDGVSIGTVTMGLTATPTTVGINIGAMPTVETRWQIRGVDDLGRTSAASNSVTTGIGHPAPPGGVTGLSAHLDDDQVLLTWDDLGTAYTYRVGVGGSTVAEPRTAGAALPAPAIGETRTYAVSAVDAWGQTGPTASASVTGMDKPAMTVAPSVVGTPVVGQTVSTPDAFTGADTVTHEWHACLNGSCTAVAGDTTHLVTAAEVGKQLEVQATATNAAGVTSAVSPLSGVVVPTVPGAPTIGTATAGDASATVRWTAPADTGGSPITGFTVRAYDGATAVGTTPAGAGATTVAVSGLTNGTAYRFTVTATNAAGTSATSAQSAAVTPEADLAPAPELSIVRKLAGGGMSLWRMPLADQDAEFGKPALLTSLSTGGFTYDRSFSLTGNVADVTAADDGSPDQLLWHAGANGGALVWAVGGGSDRTPRLWHDLRSGGWAWASSTPLIGDVTGDGWDDLVVRHATAAGDSIVWVFRSDGHRVGTPENWGRTLGPAQRAILADVDDDGREDVLVARATSSTGKGLAYDVQTVNGSGTAVGTRTAVFSGSPTAGWSYASSRTLAGDVTGDGLVDVVTVHVGANNGLVVWVHRNCSSGGSVCFAQPVLWQDLRTAGWSYSGSRQFLADTDGDGREDLVSQHSAGTTGGFMIWRHRSNGTQLLAPQLVTDLRAGGWSYAGTRAAVG